MTPSTTHRFGATPVAGGTRFAAWATRAKDVRVRLFSDRTTPGASFPMQLEEDGVFSALIADAAPGTLYMFELDGEPHADPYARCLPFGVAGPARVEARSITRPLCVALKEGAVIYELHVGTFTEEGTFWAAAYKLPHLQKLGVDVIELMPIAAFAGNHGWGYDGVAHFAPHAPYGAPNDLRAFIDEAHRLGIGVILDVVYNHFGPAGCEWPSFAPEYFTSKHKTAWGDSPDFANPFVREYVTSNVSYWLEEMGFDGLRLDATHGIVDESSTHILEEIASIAHGLAPRRRIFAEDERNDEGLVSKLGLDGVWADDFHHDVHVTLTGEREGYYCGYEPGTRELARTIASGWLYRGQVYPPTGQPRGTAPDALSPACFIHCIQNHDQIGNRAMGERLSALTSLDAYLTASMLLLFLPTTPLLFMGQEWAATSPFLYFTDHDQDLGEKICEGRRREFATFESFRSESSRERIPNPQARQTFLDSKLRWRELALGPNARVFDLYRRMLQLRREDPCLRETHRPFAVEEAGGILRVRRTNGADSRLLVASFVGEPVLVPELAHEVLVASSAAAVLDGSRLGGHTAVVLAGES